MVHHHQKWTFLVHKRIFYNTTECNTEKIYGSVLIPCKRDVQRNKVLSLWTSAFFSRFFPSEWFWSKPHSDSWDKSWHLLSLSKSSVSLVTRRQHNGIRHQHLVHLEAHWWTKHAYFKAWYGCLFRCYTTENQRSMKQNTPKRSVGKDEP